MRVILLKDVPKIGKKHEVRDVAEGFARNHLFPRNLAVLATPEKLSRIEKEKAHSEHARELLLADLRNLAEKTKETPLLLTVSANDKGHLFQAIHGRDIVQALDKAYGVTLSEKEVVLSHPIKETGGHEFIISAHNATFKCILTVVAKK